MNLKKGRFPSLRWKGQRPSKLYQQETKTDPRIPPEQKDMGDNTNSRAIIDACRPFHWRDKFPKVNMPSPELARRAMEKFGYLLK